MASVQTVHGGQAFHFINSTLCQEIDPDYRWVRSKIYFSQIIKFVDFIFTHCTDRQFWQHTAACDAERGRMSKICPENLDIRLSWSITIHRHHLVFLLTCILVKEMSLRWRHTRQNWYKSSGARNLHVSRSIWYQFLSDRTTNGRAYATVLRLSSSSVVVCNVMYCG